MQILTRNDLMSLEQYAEARSDFRARIMAHKKTRNVAIGAHATLYFEDRLTMQYQVQEMLRVERIFEPAGIEEELATYNPLIPNGSNWKATFMMEYADVDQRRDALARLVGVENKIWAQVGERAKVHPIADEDLQRSDDEKTSSVHFLRFELTPEMCADMKAGAALSMGIDHSWYNHRTQVDPAVRDSLANDLE